MVGPCSKTSCPKFQHRPSLTRKLRTCVFLAGPPPVQATEQELSHCSSWKSGPRTQAGSFPFPKPASGLVSEDDPCWWNLGTPWLVGLLSQGREACGWFDFSAGSAGGLAIPSLRPPAAFSFPSPRARPRACPFPGKTSSGGLGDGAAGVASLLDASKGGCREPRDGLCWSAGRRRVVTPALRGRLAPHQPTEDARLGHSREP